MQQLKYCQIIIFISLYCWTWCDVMRLVCLYLYIFNCTFSLWTDKHSQYWGCLQVPNFFNESRKKKIVKSNLKISKPFKIAINKINNKIKYYLSHMTHSLGWDQIFLVQQAHLEDTIFANHLNFSGFSNSVIGSTQSLDTSANTSE